MYPPFATTSGNYMCNHDVPQVPTNVLLIASHHDNTIPTVVQEVTSEVHIQGLSSRDHIQRGFSKQQKTLCCANSTVKIR